jgi:hypothetical protein
LQVFPSTAGRTVYSLCEMHAHERHAYGMAAYERHTYETACERCTSMRDKPMRWPMGEARL